MADDRCPGSRPGALRLLPGALTLLVFIAPVFAAAQAPSVKAPPAEAEGVFATRVWPLLSQKCLACHGKDGKTLQGGLDLRTLEAARRGGKSRQPAVAAGKPEQSPLYLAVTRRHAPGWAPMPPKENDRLTPEQVELLRRWIAGGAPWPDEKRRAVLVKTGRWDAAGGVTVPTSGGLSPQWTERRYRPEDLWAYRPLRKPPVPRSGVHPVDAFIEQKLARLGLKPAPPADRRTLIRRVTYDLTGLPPTPAEVEAFLNDRSPNAWEKVIDRLLASPHYGERWGRHWLDVVRYADSSGFANDYERGNAWRYRDYVIRSFNEDRPYDRFIVEQLAGDEVGNEEMGKWGNGAGEGNEAMGKWGNEGSTVSSFPHFPISSKTEALIAAGFLRMGPWELTGMEVAKVARQRFLDDVTDSVGQVFLGHALQCARCHDHKFDPVPTKDYYRIQAVFATTQLAEREAPFLKAENTAGFEERRILEKRREDYRALLRRLDEKSLAAVPGWFVEKGLDPSAWEKAVEELRASREREGFRTLFSETRTLLMRRGVPESQVPPQHLGFTPQEFGLERIARKGLERLRWEMERYEPFALSVYSGRTPALRSVNAPLRVPAERLTAGELEETAILPGGDPFAPAARVEPGVLSAIGSLAGHTAPVPDTVEGRRLALARWIASPRNPLTARVMVNRIWLWHFGQPLAGNPNNFGATGKKPTHPELLDWLASYFVEGNGEMRKWGNEAAISSFPHFPISSPRPWSIKAMHRLILSSAAYRRGRSHPDPKALAAKDPNGTSYAVFRPRRLTAEELRDSMLAVSGELNRRVGGIPARPEIHLEAALQPRQVMGTFAAAWEPSPRPEQRHRRSVYVLKIRGLRDPFMEVFNEPSPDLSCEAREASTVTPQVFSLFNGKSAYDRALALAARLRKESGSPDAVVRAAFVLAFGRPPDAQEAKETRAHWEAMTARHRGLKFDPPAYPREVEREAVEENTGERFRFTERLHAYEAFIPDLQPGDVDAETRGLADVCLALFNANEFAYVY
jgi:mono/diheme cytochrome c family protein